MEEKTLKERIEELKKNSYLQYIDVSVLDCFPEDFWLLTVNLRTYSILFVG